MAIHKQRKLYSTTFVIHQAPCSSGQRYIGSISIFFNYYFICKEKFWNLVTDQVVSLKQIAETLRIDSAGRAYSTIRWNKQYTV